MTKLIVLRGNSGSGKSTVARAIQEQVSSPPVLIEHDYIRRKVLKEHEGPDVLNPELIYRMAEYALENSRDVIIEGIMRIDIYRQLFDKLIALYPDEHYFYYFDIPLKETIKRHRTKVDADFGVDKMREWYKHHDEAGYDGEIVIPAKNSLEQTIEQVIRETGILR